MRARETEAKHMRWCNDNGLKIYPITYDNQTLRIAVARLRNKVWVEKVGFETYPLYSKKNEWGKKIDELYTHYYLMHHDKDYKLKFKTRNA